MDRLCLFVPYRNMSAWTEREPTDDSINARAKEKPKLRTERKGRTRHKTPSFAGHTNLPLAVWVKASASALCPNKTRLKKNLFLKFSCWPPFRRPRNQARPSFRPASWTTTARNRGSRCAKRALEVDTRKKFRFWAQNPNKSTIIVQGFGDFQRTCFV